MDNTPVTIIKNPKILCVTSSPPLNFNQHAKNIRDYIGKYKETLAQTHKAIGRPPDIHAAPIFAPQFSATNLQILQRA